jgi:hypothetical protein
MKQQASGAAGFVAGSARKSAAVSFRSPLWAWLATAVVAVAYVYADRENQFAGAVVSALVFALVQSFLPACRPVASAPLCPWNWALILFVLQLVVLPLSLLLLGPSIGVLPDLPSHFAINMAMILNSAAFLAFAVTYEVLSGGSVRKQESRRAEEKARDSALPSRGFNWLCFALGIAGFFLAFHTLGRLLDYYENPADNVDRLTAASHTLAGLTSLFLRPFLGFAIVVLWCRWIDRNNRSQKPRWAVLITLASITAVVLSYSTFGYNRGSFVVPLVAMIATLLTRAKWVSFGLVAAVSSILATVLVVAPFWAVYRSSNLTAADLIDDAVAANSLGGKIDLLQTLQMYGSGPQYEGFLLEKSHWGSQPYLGATLVPSLAEPLPVVGRTLRSSSGPYIYNQMIYGNPEILDQILPFSGEMFLNFGIVGVMVGSSLLALLAFRLQLGFERAGNSLETYLWQYAGMWCLFLVMGSISVVTQELFYFFWPIYSYAIWKRIR